MNHRHSAGSVGKFHPGVVVTSPAEGCSLALEVATYLLLRVKQPPQLPIDLLLELPLR